MNQESYTDLEISSDALEYRFMSKGPKGNIPKIIQFQKTSAVDVFNLVFGNLNDDGSIDDLIVNDNKDRNKILATIASVIYEFTKIRPNQFIFFSGSTPQRTRLYRMAIAINLKVLKADFEIFGVIQLQQTFLKVHFEKTVDYFGFLIKRKSINFIS